MMSMKLPTRNGQIMHNHKPGRTALLEEESADFAKTISNQNETIVQLLHSKLYTKNTEDPSKPDQLISDFFNNTIKDVFKQNLNFVEFLRENGNYIEESCGSSDNNSMELKAMLENEMALLKTQSPIFEQIEDVIFENKKIILDAQHQICKILSKIDKKMNEKSMERSSKTTNLKILPIRPVEATNLQSDEHNLKSNSSPINYIEIVDEEREDEDEPSSYDLIEVVDEDFQTEIDSSYSVKIENLECTPPKKRRKVESDMLHTNAKCAKKINKCKKLKSYNMPVGRPRKNFSPDGKTELIGSEVDVYSEIPIHVRTQLEAVVFDEDDRLKCIDCDNRFTSKQSLTSHFVKFHSRIKQKQCLYCDQKFRLTGDLTRHIRLHTGEKPFKCDFADCTESFSFSYELKRHQCSHNGIAAIRYICGVCLKGFGRSCDLRRHEKIHSVGQPGTKTFECNVCKRQFVRLDHYTSHQIRSNCWLENLKCTQCPRKFLSKQKFKKHMQSHELNSNFKCFYCDWCFETRYQIFRHMTEKHNPNNDKTTEDTIKNVNIKKEKC